MIDKESPSVRARVYLLGDLYVERRTPDGSWEAVASDSEEWGPGTYARTLLRYLLCHGRRVGRGTILDTLWPQIDSAERYLNNAASIIRRVLRSHEPGGLLEAIYSRTAYQLADQARLWMDYDYCEALLQEAERVGHTTIPGLGLLKQAESYLSRGPFLADELGDWCLGQQENVRTVSYRCRLWLAEAYEAQQEVRQAEKVVAALLREDPTDENALCYLMRLLHSQGLTAEALRRCQHAAALLARQGLSLCEQTEQLAKQLQSQRRVMLSSARASALPPAHQIAPPIVLASRRDLLHELLTLASTALYTPPYELLHADDLQRLAYAVHTPTSLDSCVLMDLNSITNAYWRLRENGAALPALLPGALGHMQTVVHFLKHAPSVVTRRELCAVTRKAAQFIGCLLLDMRDLPLAWSYFTLATHAAQGAGQPDGEAAVLAWTSFLFTYQTQPQEMSPEACPLLEQAQHLTKQSTTLSLRTHLAVIKAEIHANLRQFSACEQELDCAENLLTSLADPEDVAPMMGTSFGRARFAGYKGVCLLRMGKPHEALLELEKAQQSRGNRPVNAVILTDLGVGHAQLGAYQQACLFAYDALTQVAQMKLGTHFRRVLWLRNDLEPWAHTSEVKELDQRLNTTSAVLAERDAYYTLTLSSRL